MRDDSKLEELDKEVYNIKWDIIKEQAEIRRRGKKITFIMKETKGI